MSLFLSTIYSVDRSLLSTLYRIGITLTDFPVSRLTILHGDYQLQAGPGLVHGWLFNITHQTTHDRRHRPVLEMGGLLDEIKVISPSRIEPR